MDANMDDLSLDSGLEVVTHPEFFQRFRVLIGPASSSADAPFETQRILPPKQASPTSCFTKWIMFEFGTICAICKKALGSESTSPCGSGTWSGPVIWRMALQEWAFRISVHFLELKRNANPIFGNFLVWGAHGNPKFFFSKRILSRSEILLKSIFH